MGSSRWSASDWQTHTTRTASQSRQQIFSQSNLHDDLDPKKITVRESVDSDQNPNSTPIILASDVTASMGVLAETIIRKDLGLIMGSVYDRKPVPDPHIMCMAVGDAFVDTAPLQVTQFEADIKLADQMKNIWLEGGGGGNGGESYSLVWYFAHHRTRCDSQIKRGKKGYIFTIGDEAPHEMITNMQIKNVFGDNVEGHVHTKALLETISLSWEVFHLIVNPSYPQAVTSWRDLLGERAIEIPDHEAMGEVIVSTMQIIEGADPDTVAKSWSGDTSLVVANATRNLVSRGGSAAAGVSRL